jgi:hypothetical protein
VGRLVEARPTGKSGVAVLGLAIHVGP